MVLNGASVMQSPFRLAEPSTAHLAAFHRDGYVALPDVFTDEARTGLIAEIMHLRDVRAYMERLGLEADTEDAVRPYFVRPWNEISYGPGTSGVPGGIRSSTRLW